MNDSDGLLPLEATGNIDGFTFAVPSEIWSEILVSSRTASFANQTLN
jgi:hypothetical protein